jgi:hypothetical protein
MPPLREYCPHCGTPVRLGRRGSRAEAPGKRSDEELKRNRRTVLIVGAAILLTMGIAGKVSWFAASFERHDRHQGPVVIEAEQVYDAYRDDAHAAARRFRGREMVVSGEFVRIVPDGQGNPDLRLKTANPEAPLGADLVPISYDAAARLRPGQIVTVSCQRITRTGDERWLQNCAIQTAAPPAPSPPKAPSAPPPPGDGNSG